MHFRGRCFNRPETERRIVLGIDDDPIGAPDAWAREHVEFNDVGDVVFVEVSADRGKTWVLWRIEAVIEVFEATFAFWTVRVTPEQANEEIQRVKSARIEAGKDN